jgi:uncharacterized protein YdeI (YjbR/CyaY-like superfamily)
MSARDPRIDAYIAAAEPFARPILEHLRALVHESCPGVEETLKWRMPAFVAHGAILCTMAAFKRHAAFGFWRHAEVIGSEPPGEAGDKGMGSFGKLTSVRDLPPKTRLRALLKQAAALNASGAKPARVAKAASKPMPAMPPDLVAALDAAPKAKAAFDAFPPSHRREYMEWILEAKRAETRARRIVQTIEWLREGKSRNWKYERG